ncbi:MAG: peptidase [Burkholderia sp.]|nr:peptidase [Burkholderia sp.]
MNKQTLKLASVVGLAATLAACGGGNESSSSTTAQFASSVTAVPSATDSLAPSLDQGTLAPLNDLMPAQTATRYDASAVSADGAVIAFTVYAPNIAVGNSAPLLIEGHGWGGKRTKNLDTTAYSDAANTPLQTAKLALDSGMQGGKQPTRGWYVISFDQRGFGDSGGFANVMDPQIEGKDVKAIIDWAQANLPRLAHRKNSSGVQDPVVGAVGLSYGGGFQTIGSGVDKRIDAIVPTATWSDLRYSIYNQPKSEYLSLLVGVGAAGLGRAEPFTYQAFVDASTTNQVSANFSQKMYLHSDVSYCEGASPDMQQPGIPAFFIQGSNDILFNLNEAFQSFECFRKANPKSKLMAVRFGHPDVLINNSMPKFTEENVSCGNMSIPVARLAFSFLSQNLIDPRLTESYSSDYLTVPDLRAVLEDGSPTSGPKGETAEGKCYEVGSFGTNKSGTPLIQRGGTNVTASPAVVQNLFTGLPSLLAGVVIPNDPSTLSSPAMTAYTSPAAGQVVTLVPASGKERALMGMATVHLNVAPTNPLQAAIDNPPILFLGLVRTTPDGKQQLVHDQVWPVSGFGEQTVTLPGVSMLLHGNDNLGLVVYGYHPQYFNYHTKVPMAVNVSSLSASLPFVN